MSDPRRAVALTFFGNGLFFSTWVSRIPELRAGFGLDNRQLGLVLLAVAVGSLVALPTTGASVRRWGTRAVTRCGSVTAAAGLLLAGTGLGHSLGGVVGALVLFGLGIGVWDVAMNVEGAAVERVVGRTLMPRFHAAFSLGTVVGAGAGAGLVHLEVPVALHLGVVALLGCCVVGWVASGFVAEPVRSAGPTSSVRVWLEPRTLLVGVVVLALALTEGTANDWLAVALVDGHGTSHAGGVAGFALFVVAMTAGRWWGSRLLDRFGRVVVLRSTIALAGGGVLLIVLTTSPLLVVLGILAWGAGASLGFPVGMSAAADDPVHAAARVGAVATIGYAAFLAGPPLLGLVGDQVGSLRALLVVVLALVPAALLVPVTRVQAVGAGR